VLYARACCKGYSKTVVRAKCVCAREKKRLESNESYKHRTYARSVTRYCAHPPRGRHAISSISSFNSSGKRLLLHITKRRGSVDVGREICRNVAFMETESRKVQYACSQSESSSSRVSPFSSEITASVKATVIGKCPFDHPSDIRVTIGLTAS
jgi:hypothetical protein